MLKQHIILAAGLALAAGACASTAQQSGSRSLAGAQCSALADVDQELAALYAPGSVQQVAPLYTVEHRARALQLKYVSGAKVYVPAQRGMTDGYLERVLSCHVASQSESHPNDPLQVADIKDVDVSTRGPWFLIEIHGANRAAGKQILERANALRESSANVSVRQLSSAATVSGM